MNKKSLIAIVLFLLLAGGGAGAAYMMGRSLDAEPAAEPDEVVDIGRVAFVRMPPINVPVYQGDTVRRYVQMSVSLEVPEGSSLTAIRKQVPRLRDAFVTELSGQSVMRRDGSGVLDLDLLKVRLLKRARGVLGETRVSDVLLGNAAG